MKIAFIGQKGITNVTGGVERRVSEVSTRMAKKGHDVFVYTRNNHHDNNEKMKTYKGVNLIYLPTLSFKNLEAIIHTFIASVHAIFQDYDVIHYQAPGPSSLSWMIKIFRPGVVLVATFNSQDRKHEKWGFLAKAYLKFGERIISTVPDKTIVVSDILKKAVKVEYGKDAVLIHNGAYVVKSEKTDFIEQFGLKKGKYFLTISRLIKHKGIHYLINAFKAAKADGDIPADFKLVVVGDGAYTDDYVSQIKAMSLDRDDILLMGSQSDKELHAQLFTHAYCYVQPSEAEGLSNSLLEALGHGLGVIVSDIPENKLPVGENGLIFKNTDVDELRQKMIFAINNPEELGRIGNRAKENTDKNYNWQVNTERTLLLYNDLKIQKIN